MASNSQASTHEKHSTHAFLSISYRNGTACPNDISIAFLLPKCSSKKLVVKTGHTSAHAPHPLHSSVVYRGFLSTVTL